MLLCGADVQSRTDGISPLHACARRQYKDVVQLLIDAQANVNAPSDFGTPLERARDSDCVANIKILEAAGAM